MLSILNRCDRREFLRIGGWGLAGFGSAASGLGSLTLADLLAAKAAGASRPKSLATGKSVVFLLLHGGPTQHETFDPKMDGPEGTRTLGGVTETSTPGVQFGSTLQKLAPWTHRPGIQIIIRHATNKPPKRSRARPSRPIG